MRNSKRSLPHSPGEAIDVLIHNAGVYGTLMRAAKVNRINAEAPIEVAEALMDAVLRSEQKKIALITSQMGARHGSGRRLGKYGESKAALNDRFRTVERDWRKAGCLAVVIHPGWVRTDMGGSSASISVEESARGIRRVMEGLDESSHGRFWTWDGREHSVVVASGRNDATTASSRILWLNPLKDVWLPSGLREVHRDIRATTAPSPGIRRIPSPC